MLPELVCYRHLQSLFGVPKGTINRKKIQRKSENTLFIYFSRCRGYKKDQVFFI